MEGWAEIALWVGAAVAVFIIVKLAGRNAKSIGQDVGKTTTEIKNSMSEFKAGMKEGAEAAKGVVEVRKEL